MTLMPTLMRHKTIPKIEQSKLNGLAQEYLRIEEVASRHRTS